MRICGKCKINPKRNASSSYCKSCHNEYQKAYYKKYPVSTKLSSKRRSLEIRDIVKSAKDIPCKDCGIKYPYYVMDFDHIRGIKKYALSVAASKHRALSNVQDEISKCDVVCANCHRERTFSRLSCSVTGNTTDFESVESRFEP